MTKAIAPSLLLAAHIAAPILIALFAPAIAQAQAASPILGTWETEDRVLKIAIFESSGTFSGRVLHGQRLMEADGRIFKKDVNNPDPALRGRSLQGITIVKNLKWNAASKRWDGGEWYDGTSGRMVSARAEMADGKLEMRVYRGAPIMGRTLVLRRVAG